MVAKYLLLIPSLSLEEYLTELSMANVNPSNIDPNAMQLIQDSKSTATNFTNAAILLQNSSSVYSRKVEYLHTLVYQALERLSSNHQKAQEKKKNVDPDVYEFQGFDPDWNFLVFEEDTLPVDLQGNTIDLPSHMAEAVVEEEDNHLAGYSQHAQGGIHSPLYKSPNQTRLSLGGLDTTNMNDTLMQSVVKDRKSIQSHLGQQLIRSIMEGSQGMASSTGMDNAPMEGQAVLRLMSGVCDVNESSGALLIPGTGIQYDDHNGKDDGRHADLGLTFQQDHTVEESIENRAISFDQGMDDGVNDDDYSHDNEGGGGFELHSPAANMSTDNVQENVLQAARNNVNNEKANVIHEKPKYDPWNLLDPHDTSFSKSRPLKASITCRLPEGVDKPPSSTVLGTKTKKFPREKKRQLSIDEDQSVEIEDGKMIPMPLDQLAYGEEFLYVKKAQIQRVNAEKRRLRKLEQEARTKNDEYASSTQAIKASEEFDNMYNDDYDEDNDEGVGFDFAGDDDNDSVDRERDVFENVFHNDDQIQNSDGKTFEELCRLHLKEFAKGAEQFAVETQLSKRVSNWQNNLEKVLADEEDRPEFNIQTYGSRIIQNAETCLRQQKKRGFQRMSSGGNDEEENLVRILYIIFSKEYDTQTTSYPL